MHFTHEDIVISRRGNLGYHVVWVGRSGHFRGCGAQGRGLDEQRWAWASCGIIIGYLLRLEYCSSRMLTLLKNCSSGTVSVTERELFTNMDGIRIITNIFAQVLWAGCDPKSTIWTSGGYIDRRLGYITKKLRTQATRKHQPMRGTMPSKIVDGEVTTIEFLVLWPTRNQVSQLYTDPCIWPKELTMPKASDLPFLGHTWGFDQNLIVFRQAVVDDFAAGLVEDSLDPYDNGLSMYTWRPLYVTTSA